MAGTVMVEKICTHGASKVEIARKQGLWATVIVRTSGNS